MPTYTITPGFGAPGLTAAKQKLLGAIQAAAFEACSSAGLAYRASIQFNNERVSFDIAPGILLNVIVFNGRGHFEPTWSWVISYGDSLLKPSSWSFLGTADHREEVAELILAAAVRVIAAVKLVEIPS